MTPAMRFLTFAVIIVCFLLPSCARHDKPQATKVIGVTLLTRGHMFYRDLEEGIRTEAAQYEYEVIITAAEFDLGKQISQIEDFVAQGVDAIVVCPVDSRGVGTGIKRANEARIPVFTADIAAQEGEIMCHIASDNVAGGRLAGEYLAKVLRQKGSVAIINQPALTSTLDRVQGFRESLARYPGIKIVADVNGFGVRDRALQVSADVLQANPQLDAIFGINDDSALGALDAVRQFKRTNIVIVGYDATPPAQEAILRGTALKADVIQYPSKIGSTTIQTIRKFFLGESIPSSIPVEVGLVDSTILHNALTTGAVNR